MLMMPCHLALNSRGALTGARNAISQPGESWGCSSCGCRLVLHILCDVNEHPLFDARPAVRKNFCTDVLSISQPPRRFAGRALPIAIFPYPGAGGLCDT